MALSATDECSNFNDPDVDVSGCSITDAYGVTWDEINSKPLFPFVVAIMGPVLVFSTVGNGLILLILWTKSSMRNSLNIVIGNMAFADLICCSIVAVRAIGRNMEHNYVLGETFCKYDTFSKNVPMFVSDLSLVLLCYERLKVLWWPFLVSESNKASYLKCMGIWVFAVIVYSWELNHYRKLVTRVWADDFVEVSCIENGSHYYWKILVTVLCIYLPDIATSVLYILFLRAIKKMSTVCESADESAIVEKERKYEKMIAMMIVVNLMFSWISWFPDQFLFLNPYNDLSQRWSDWTENWYLAYHILVAMRCMVNPLVYGYANRSFRREVWKLVPTISINESIMPA